MINQILIREPETIQPKQGPQGDEKNYSRDRTGGAPGAT
jgi:hypothetical protein